MRNSFTPSNPRNLAGGMNKASDFPFDVWKDFDYLGTNYPVWKPQIQQARNKGIPDNLIQEYIETELEPRMRFIAAPDAVNEFLGRTPETMQQIADYESARQRHAYKQAFPDKSDDEIFNAIEMSRQSGVSTGNLLGNPELYKKLLRGRKERENLAESLYRGGHNYLVNNDMGAAGWQAMMGTISTEEMFKRREELSKKLIDEPAILTFGNKALAGAASISAQGIKNQAKGFMLGGLLESAAEGLGVMTGTSGIIPKGAAFSVGYYYANAMELFEDQAGNDYAELLSMRDENGNPIPEDVARNIAMLSGAITVGTELVGLKYALNLMPLGQDIKNLMGAAESGLTKEILYAMAKSSNPLVRTTLAKTTIDIAKGIGISSFNNVVESFNTNLKVPLAQEIANTLYGRKFPAYDYSHVLPDAKNTLLTSIRDFGTQAILMSPLTYTNTYRHTIRPFKQAQAEIAQKTGIPEAQIERAIAQNIVDSMQARTEQESTPQTENITQEETQTQAPVQETQAEVSAQEAMQADMSNTQAEYVFIPTKAFETLKAKHPEIGELEVLSAGDEVGLTNEQYQQLKEQYSTFFSDISDNTRLNADGITPAELAHRVNATDPAKAQILYSEEMQKGIDYQRQNYEKAGLDAEQADMAANLWGEINAAMQAKTGVPMPNIEIITQEERQAEIDRANDMSRINSPEYDINNPATWTDQNRAQRLMQIAENGKLTNMELFIKRFVELATGKKNQAGEVEAEAETEAIDDGVKSSMTQEIRAEIKDYSASLKTANQDAVEVLASQEWNAEQYEANAMFPKGKNRTPDHRYEFSNYDGKTVIDLAESKGNLYVKVKNAGNKKPFVLSIKDYKNADFQQIIEDLGQGTTARGVYIGRTPVVQNIALALNEFWSEQVLPRFQVQQLDYERPERPNVITPDIERSQRPETIALESEREQVPVHDGMEGLERSQVDVLGGLENVDNSTVNVLGGLDTLERSQVGVRGGLNSIEQSGKPQVFGGMETVERTEAPDTIALNQARDRVPVRNGMANLDRTEAPQVRGGFEAINAPNVHSINTKLQAPETMTAPDEFMTQIPRGETKDTAYSSIDDEAYYSPEAQESNAAIDDLPAQHTPDTIPETIRTDKDAMPELARRNLEEDTAKWADTVDATLANEKITSKSRKTVQVMRFTPQVLTLVGAKNLHVYMNDYKLSQILTKHEGMTADMLKDLPSRLTDPVAIFESAPTSSQSEGGLVVLTDMKDSNGASVNIAFHMDVKTGGKKGYVINKIASAFGREKKGTVDNQWFRNEATNDRLRYINTEKAAQWAQDTGIDILDGRDVPEGVKTQADLHNAWSVHEKEGYFKIDPKTGEPISRIEINAWGRAIVEMLAGSRANANFATHVHDIGHALFGMIDSFAQEGIEQMVQDRDYVLERAGVTLEEWLAEKPNQRGGAREKAHEWFANAFEVYLSEGKAPTPRLAGVFERAKKFLLEIYDDITNQLGVELNDQDRELFDRLLMSPSDTNSVAEYAVQEAMAQKQIRAYREQLRLAQQEQERELQEYYALEEEREAKHQRQQDFLNEVRENESERYQSYIDTLQQAEEMEVDTYHLAPEALEQVYDYDRTRELHDEEVAAMPKKYTLDKDVDAVFKAIKQIGYISGEDVKHVVGEEAAKKIAKRWTRLWSGKTHGEGQPLSVIADKLANMGFKQFYPDIDVNTGEGRSSVQQLIHWLETAQRTYKLYDEAVPNVKVNEQTVDAMLAYWGNKGTIDYLNERKEYIEQRKGQPDAPVHEIDAEAAAIDSYIEELQVTPVTKSKTKKKTPLTVVDLKNAGKAGYKLGRQTERIVQKGKQAERIAELKETGKQKVEDAKAREQERASREIEKLTARHQRRIDKLNQRIERLKNFNNNNAQKQAIKDMVKDIASMRKSKTISYERLQEINELLDGYNLSNKGISQRNLIREFLDVDSLPSLPTDAEIETSIEQQMSDAGITQQDIEAFLDKVHIEDMPISEVRGLHEQVKSIFRQGRVEYEAWKEAKQQRQQDMRNRLAEAITSSTKAPEPRVIKGKEDITHQYKLGRVGEYAARYWYGTMTPGRFLEGLGEPFREILEDGVTERRGEAFRHIREREHFVLSRLEQLGITSTELMDTAITVDGQKYQWQRVMEIYAGMQNEFTQPAIIFGNFLNNAADSNKLYHTVEEAMGAINQILDFINQPENVRYKQAAEIILQDFEMNFDRIKAAQVENFNTGMNKQERYSPMIRLRHQSSQGLMINDETEQIARNSNFDQMLQATQHGYTKERLRINPENQEPINLDLFANWQKAVHEQEFDAALGGYAADVRSALLVKGENGSVQEFIQSRHGQHAWDMIRSIFNSSIIDNATSEATAADKIANWFIQNRSFTYVAFSLSSELAQTTSHFLSYCKTNPKYLFRSLWNYVDMLSHGRHNEFMESVYQDYPELRFSGGAPVVNAIQQGQKFTSFTDRFGEGARNTVNRIRKFREWAYGGVRFFDQVTKAITFDAEKNAQLEKGKSYEDAVRLGIRMVLDTQPASSAREMTQFNRESKGVNKLLFTQFMNALAPVWNVGVVDIARALSSPSWNNVKRAAGYLTATVMAITFGGYIKSALSGRLPTGDELPNGLDDTWDKWLLDTNFEGLLNTMPMLNLAASNIYRHIAGNKVYRSSNRLIEPFEKGYDAISKWADDKEENNAQALDATLESLALITGIVPYSGIKQLARWFGFYDKDK